MDVWKLKEARAAFRGAMQSRQQWVDAVGDRSLFTQLRQKHDELALAMCQRYSGNHEEAVAGYQAVRRSLGQMRQRVNRIPLIERGWQMRHYNTCERYGDCFLFGGSDRGEAVHQFRQAAEDLRRDLVSMDQSEAPEFRIQYARFLAKEAVARILDGEGGEVVEALRRNPAIEGLSGSFRELIELFADVGELLVAARGDAESARALERLAALVEKNQRRQFGRDVREMFLLMAKNLASRCEGEEARRLAEVMMKLLPKPPVDRSVLPFLRPHFDRLFALKLKASELDWATVRDLHWAKTGARLGEDRPSRPLVMVYLREESAFVVGFHPDETHQVVSVPHGLSDLAAFGRHGLVLNVLEGTSLTAGGAWDLYWSDAGLIPPQTRESLPFALPDGAELH